MRMRKTVDVILILGFLVIDFLFFHDFFKAQDEVTLPQYLTGLLSIPILIRSLRSLWMKK